jgi:hypothetical protein
VTADTTINAFIVVSAESRRFYNNKVYFHSVSALAFIARTLDQPPQRPKGLYDGLKTFRPA